MWWTTDNRLQRQPKRFVEAMTSQTLLKATSKRTDDQRRDLKRRYLKLPITTDQAAANLMLQESGADRSAELPRLRKDILSLESTLRDVVAQSKFAASSIDSLKSEKRQQLEKIDCMLVELATTHGENEDARRRLREEGEWLKIAVDLANSLASKAVQQTNDAEQQVSELRVALDQLGSENQDLTNQLEAAHQEGRIFADVISDMESRQTSELHQAREQNRLLTNRLSQDGAADRSQVQQLNIRIVSQAAEIRSLNKQLVKLQRSDSSHESGYATILDNEAMNENTSLMELNERLENSLQSARVELESAVHELKYANAETNRLREHAKQVEQRYDSEFYHLVQVAELHATFAALLEKSRERGAAEAAFLVDSPIVPQVANERSTSDEQMASDHDSVDALKLADMRQPNAGMSSEESVSQAQELRSLEHELGTLRESQARLAGENQTLSACNQALEQRLNGLTQQLAETEKARSAEKFEQEKLLAHHLGGTQVANAECRLIKGKMEDQRNAYEFKLKQQLEVINCLNADVGAARGLQSQLQKKLEVEILNRQLAEEETKVVRREVARMLDSLPVDSDQGDGNKNNIGDEPDDECGAGSSVKAAA